MKRWVYLIILLRQLWAPTLIAAAPCTICPDANTTITKPEKEINIPDAAFSFLQTCGDLDSFIGFFEDNHELCPVIRNVSTICGCPIPEGGCSLCGDYSKTVGEPHKLVPIIFADQFDAFVPTCEIFEAYLYNIPGTDGACPLAQSILQDYCGCPSDEPASEFKPCSLCPNGEVPTLVDKPLNIEGFPISNCGDLFNATSLFLSESSETCSLLQSVSTFCGCPKPIENSCSICRNGLPVPLPNQTFDFLEADFGFKPTCAILESLLDTVPHDDRQCADFQLLGSFCGCPPVENHCEICPNRPEQLIQRRLPQLKEFSGLDMTCDEALFLQFQIPRKTRDCFAFTDMSWLCGCNNGHFSYFGADTVSKQALLAWLPRATALLSIMGSSFILWDILKDRKKRSSTFHQILVSMSCCDLLSSIGWGLTTLPIPQYDEFGDITNIYGARGNEHTCTFQGFLVQMGFTGVLYNLTLSIYYYLVIAIGWKETRLKKARIWLHSPALVGTALSFIGIPWYGNDIWGCYIQPPPIAASYGKILVFGIVPILLTLVFATCCMIAIVISVRQKSKKAAKWRRGSNKGNELEKQVLWQAIFYLSAFYISFPILAASNLFADTKELWLLVMATSLAPLQGFNNFLVYVRPRILRHYRRKRQEKNQRKPRKTESTAETGNGTGGAHQTEPQEEKQANAIDDRSAPVENPSPSPLPLPLSVPEERSPSASLRNSLRSSTSLQLSLQRSPLQILRKAPQQPLRKANANDDPELQMTESEFEQEQSIVEAPVPQFAFTDMEQMEISEILHGVDECSRAVLDQTDRFQVEPLEEINESANDENADTRPR